MKIPNWTMKYKEKGTEVKPLCRTYSVNRANLNSEF